MKTTIDLPPDLLRSAARLATAKGTALSEMIEKLLRRHLRRAVKKPASQVPVNDLPDWREELL